MQEGLKENSSLTEKQEKELKILRVKSKSLDEEVNLLRERNDILISKSESLFKETTEMRVENRDLKLTNDQLKKANAMELQNIEELQIRRMAAEKHKEGLEEENSHL